MVRSSCCVFWSLELSVVVSSFVDLAGVFANAFLLTGVWSADQRDTLRQKITIDPLMYSLVVSTIALCFSSVAAIVALRSRTQLFTFVAKQAKFVAIVTTFVSGAMWLVPRWDFLGAWGYLIAVLFVATFISIFPLIQLHKAVAKRLLL